MNLFAEKEIATLGKTTGAGNHDDDMIHELSNRLNAVARYDQYIANAASAPELQKFWRRLKAQDEENAEELKDFIAEHVDMNCF